MPRKYIRPLGAKPYCNYIPEALENALEAIVDGNASIREAAERFGVPKTTLHSKFHGAHSDRKGRPPVLNPREEAYIVDAIMSAANSYIPFTDYDLRRLVQGYLNRKGLLENAITGSLPEDNNIPEEDSDVEENVRIDEAFESDNENSIEYIEEFSDEEISITPENLTEGKFVVAEFIYDEGTRKENKKLFVSQITKLKKKTIEIDCMRRYSSAGRRNTFVFPQIKDTNVITLKQITKILPQPEIKRGRYVFPYNIIC